MRTTVQLPAQSVWRRLPVELHLQITEETSSLGAARAYYKALYSDRAVSGPHVQSLLRMACVYQRCVAALRERVGAPSPQELERVQAQRQADLLQMWTVPTSTGDLQLDCCKMVFRVARGLGAEGLRLAGRGAGFAYADYALFADTDNLVHPAEKLCYVMRAAGILAGAATMVTLAAAGAVAALLGLLHCLSFAAVVQAVAVLGPFCLLWATFCLPACLPDWLRRDAQVCFREAYHSHVDEVTALMTSRGAA